MILNAVILVADQLAGDVLVLQYLAPTVKLVQTAGLKRNLSDLY